MYGAADAVHVRTLHMCVQEQEHWRILGRVQFDRSQTLPQQRKITGYKAPETQVLQCLECQGWNVEVKLSLLRGICPVDHFFVSWALGIFFLSPHFRGSRLTP